MLLIWSVRPKIQLGHSRANGCQSMTRDMPDTRRAVISACFPGKATGSAARDQKGNSRWYGAAVCFCCERAACQYAPIYDHRCSYWLNVRCCSSDAQPFFQGGCCCGDTQPRFKCEMLLWWCSHWERDHPPQRHHCPGAAHCHSPGWSPHHDSLLCRALR